MKSEPNDALDILFEHRNKAYGAYLIRRSYEQSLRNALGIGLSFILLLFAFPYILKAMSGSDPISKIEIGDKILTEPPPIEPKEVPPPPKVETPPPPVQATQRVVPPLVLKDNDVKNEAPPTPPADITAEVSKVEQKGSGPQTGFVENEVPTDDLRKVEIVKKEKPEEPVTFVEIMPSFPGGEAEMLRFIFKNFKIPAISKETGVSGRIAVSFIVEKNGQISDIQILKNPGGGLGDEAIRVLQSMPPWKPGIQNGNPVRVRMTLPILIHFE